MKTFACNMTVAGTAALLLAAGAQSASALPVTFFGEDLSPGGVVAPGGAPATAQADFLATLSGTGTEDFEGFDFGDVAPINLSFPGSTGTITATLSGGGTDINVDTGAGRFATSGTKAVETAAGGGFVISFDSPISAFGFFGTDVGDFNNALELSLTPAGGGAAVPLAVGNTVGAPSGSLLYFGFVDTSASYTQIAFLNNPGSSDVFGFDDMTIGDVQQITNPPRPENGVIPLPATLPLLLSGLGAAGVAVRRRRRRG